MGESTLNDALRLDSTIRGSMQYDDLEHLSVGCVVVTARGVGFQVDENRSEHMPPGVSLGLPLHGVHRDPFYYRSPLEFQQKSFSKDCSKKSY